jgi:hypothetical protein
MPRPYRINAAVASERGRKAAAARNTPAVYIRQLARAALTDADKRRLAELLMPFLAGQAEDHGGESETA